MHGRQNVSWPQNAKRTVIREKWFERISRLSPGLDLAEAAQLLNKPYGAVRRWAVLFGYQFPDGRRVVSREQWGAVDWERRDADIARELGVTRECVRLVRRAKGVGPSAPQAAVRDFNHFVAAHVQQLHGLLVDEVIHHSGTDLPYHVVLRILRDHKVRRHEPSSPRRDINWQLPNRDLASIWGVNARYIANLRARLHAGPARWTARRRAIGSDPEYNSSVALEKQKAHLHRQNKGRPTQSGVLEGLPA